ncbi:MAG TPA: 2-oxoglutarate ferredoxin oxidoreductase subunit alpha, partial [Gammaproteobacteria bacterium]|nr:2-oxoglutarate ferredoxin oxidoreductase subunit alpha [Gammaproteobacteria bacterium]
PESLGRPWVAPGTPNLMHRIGGLEKDIRTGNISYDAQNHQAMTNLRAAKVAAVAKFIPPQRVEHGPEQGKIAVVGWGSTYGAIYQAVRAMPERERVSHIHIRHLSPFPSNLGELLRGFDQILVPEMNMGQLASLLRDKIGVETQQLNKVTGQPFLIAEIVQKIRSLLAPTAAARTKPKAVRGDRA